MKRIVSLLLAIALLCALPVTAAEEIFVLYRDGSTAVLPGDAATVERLKADPAVAVCQPNYIYEVTGTVTDDPLFAEQWALANDGSFRMEESQNRYPVYDTPFGAIHVPGQWHIPDFFGIPGGFFGLRADTAVAVDAVPGVDVGAEAGWAAYHGTKDVVIAMVDTGVDGSHEDLAGHLWVNTDEIPGNGVDDDKNGFVDDVNGWNFCSNTNVVFQGSEDDHGTHGAGTMVAVGGNGKGIVGVAQTDHVKVMPVKALGGTYGAGSTASVIRAIQYAEANGAMICNLSLGAAYNDEALYETMKSSNMLFVVAAGNDHQNLDRFPAYPASYDLENIITVANLTAAGVLDHSSNYGTAVDLAAPGSYILSTVSGNQYSYMSGTSMAAPFVSAVCAMAASQFPELTPAQVKEVVLRSAKPLESLQGSVATGGMVDLAAAMTYDTATLPAVDWGQKTPYVFKGSAPTVGIYLANDTLAVQFADEDGDLTLAAYAEGKHTAADFQGGKSGTKLTLDERGTVRLDVAPGTYTFYAADAMGNEAVQTVTLTRQESRTPSNSRRSPRRTLGFPSLFDDPFFRDFFDGFPF